MKGTTAIAELAALLGDPARADILYALHADGRVASGDLARIAGVAPSTASEHLHKLAQAGIVQAVPVGRQRQYRLADPSVAELLEGMEAVARRLAQGGADAPRLDRARVHAQTCLDHIAGELGGQIAGAMAERGMLRHAATGPSLTDEGEAWLDTLGADVAALRAGPRRVIGLCRDWTSDLPHLGGAVGGALLTGFRRLDWVRVEGRSGYVEVTPKGAAGLRRAFGIDVRPVAGGPGRQRGGPTPAPEPRR